MRRAEYPAAQADEIAQREGDPFVDEPSTPVEPQPPAPATRGPIDAEPYEVAHGPMEWDAPAPAVSSGEWLKNGTWYTQQSAVYMNRSVNVKNSIILSTDLTSSPLTPHYNNFLQIPLDMGYEPGLRSTVGRALGRDCRNRDHSVEFTFLGLTHWQVADGITAVTPGGIFVDIKLDPASQTNPTPVFNAATAQTFFETSNFNSYELNYRVGRRLPRDRAIYTRDSTWVRQAEPAPLPALLAGIRVAINNETFHWASESTEPTGTGTYDVATHNNMVGPQIGAECFYERTDWRFGVRSTAAAVVNWANQSTHVRILDANGDPLSPNRDENAEDHVLAFVGDLNVIGEYHLRPHFALRVSYGLMWVTNQALAQNQITFVPSTPPGISAGHSLFYQGVSFGFELVR